MQATVIEVLVWLGTITFAATGALAALRKRFDLVGVVVLGAVTAIGGGSVRDLVVGEVPPPALRNEPLLWAVVATSVLVFTLRRQITQGRILYVLDTVALALFAVLGAQTGIEAGLGFWGVVFTGTVSGIGGGMIRDTLSGEVPHVLHRAGDLYASAAVVGAAAVHLLWSVGELPALLVGGVLTAATRVGSRALGLRVPAPDEPR